MERERRNSGFADGDGYHSGNTNEHGTQFCNDNSVLHGDKVPSATYIQHSVSRFDTLPGVAIKYGVEVADIKKMNGLVTDLQMFGFKTLQIPLPGRHPPSPGFSNESTTSGRSSGNHTPHFRPDWLESFQSLRLMSPRKVSTTMNSLRGYCSLRSKEENISGVGGGFRGRFSRTSTIVGYELDGFEVRKSSTTSCLHDHRENGGKNGSSSLTSRWPMASKCRQTEVQAVSSAGNRRSFFDGFTKPMSARKNKAAID